MAAKSLGKSRKNMLEPLVKRRFPVNLNLLTFFRRNTIINLRKNTFKFKFIPFFLFYEILQ